MDIMDDMGASK